MLYANESQQCQFFFSDNESSNQPQLTINYVQDTTPPAGSVLFNGSSTMGTAAFLGQYMVLRPVQFSIAQCWSGHCLAGRPATSSHAQRFFPSMAVMTNPGLNIWDNGDNGPNLHHVSIGNVTMTSRDLTNPNIIGSGVSMMSLSSDGNTWGCPRNIVDGIEGIIDSFNEHDPVLDMLVDVIKIALDWVAYRNFVKAFQALKKLSEFNTATKLGRFLSALKNLLFGKKITNFATYIGPVTGTFGGILNLVGAGTALGANIIDLIHDGWDTWNYASTHSPAAGLVWNWW